MKFEKGQTVRVKEGANWDGDEIGRVRTECGYYKGESIYPVNMPGTPIFLDPLLTEVLFLESELELVPEIEGGHEK